MNTFQYNLDSCYNLADCALAEVCRSIVEIVKISATLEILAIEVIVGFFETSLERLSFSSVFNH